MNNYEVLSLKMKNFLNGMEYIDTGFIGTVDRDYVYTGFDWCRGESKYGKVLNRKDVTSIVGGNVFSYTAKKAVALSQDKDLMELMQDIENFKKIPFPVRMDDSVNVSGKSFKIFSIKAKYSPQEMRVPVIVSIQKDTRFRHGKIDEFKLTEFMANFTVDRYGLVKESSVIRFSTANYVKPLIIHKGSEAFGFDCSGVYKAVQNEDGTLGNWVLLGTLSLLGNLFKNGYLSSVSGYLGLEGISALVKFGNWICPIECGDEHHVYLDDNGNIIKDTDMTKVHERQAVKEVDEQEQASKLMKLEEEY